MAQGEWTGGRHRKVWKGDAAEPGVGFTPLALEGIPDPPFPQPLGCVPGSYLQSGSVEDNALSQTHTLAYGHPLPNGDIGAQLWRMEGLGDTTGIPKQGDRPAPELGPLVSPWIPTASP